MLVHTDTDTFFWTLVLVQNIDGSGLTNPQSYLNRSFPKERNTASCVARYEAINLQVANVSD